MDYNSLIRAVVSWHRNTLYHTDASAYQNMLFPLPPCLIKFYRLPAASSGFPTRSNFEQNVKVPFGKNVKFYNFLIGLKVKILNTLTPLTPIM